MSLDKAEKGFLFVLGIVALYLLGILGLIGFGIWVIVKVLIHFGIV